MKIFLNSLSWLFYVCVVGCLQIGIVYLLSYVKGNGHIDLIKFYSEGFFLFFVISLISGIFYEFVIETDCRGHKALKGILIVSSCTIGIIAMLVYALAFASKIEQSHSLENYKMLQNILTLASIIVASFMKGLIYYSR